jgi:hypothetical protein
MKQLYRDSLYDKHFVIKWPAISEGSNINYKSESKIIVSLYYKRNNQLILSTNGTKKKQRNDIAWGRGVCYHNATKHVDHNTKNEVAVTSILRMRWFYLS